MSDERFPTRQRILCLDGGGMRGLSLVLLLEELMLQVQIEHKLDFTPEPGQCFDFICGTSTGGLVAVLIGRLGKTLKECKEIFRTLGTKIFSEDKISQKIRLVFKGSQHASRGLKEVITEQANGQNMYDGSSTTSGYIPTAVVAVSKTTKVANLFRTYGIRANREPVSILDACLATTSATIFFGATTVNGIIYVDGGFGYNNPSELALKELESNEGPFDRMTDAVKQLSCFVSLGTGRPTHTYDKTGMTAYVTPKGITSAEDALKLLKDIATGCHQTHLEVKARFARENALAKYFRFDVDRGLEAVQLNEADEKALEQISSTTKAYIDEKLSDLVECAKKIKPQTLGNHPGTVLDLEAIARNAVVSNEAIYGADHPNTVGALELLSKIYHQNGKLPDLEVTCLRILQAKERTLGLENSSTFDAAFDLAATYEQEDKFDDAETTFLKALSGYEKTVGLDNPQTLVTVNSLGNVYAAKHDYAKAEIFYKKALEGRIRVLGRDDPDTIGIGFNLGLLYLHDTRYAEAEKMFQESYDEYDRTVGPNHRLSLRSLNSLAHVYLKSRRFPEATKMMRDILARQEVSLSPNDPEIVRTLYNLGKIYRSNDDTKNAELFLSRALEINRRIFSSPIVAEQRSALVDVANDLACLYEDQGKRNEAYALYCEELAMKQMVLHPGHPSTVGTMRNIQRLNSVNMF